MAKSLAHFTIARGEDDYLLTIEDVDGETTEFAVDYEALDIMAAAIEDILDGDEEQALEVEEEFDEDEEE